jgi:hypothetical protein
LKPGAKIFRCRKDLGMVMRVIEKIIKGGIRFRVMDDIMRRAHIIVQDTGLGRG